MPRKPDEYAVHMFLSSGHKAEVRFGNIKDFQQWYSSQLIPKHDSDDFITIPMKNTEGEYMVIRPSSVIAIRVEPIFFGSVERVEQNF